VTAVFLGISIVYVSRLPYILPWQRRRIYELRRLRMIPQVKKVDSIRQSLRMRGFRCNLVYTRACTRLNVIPLSASRPRALR